MKKLIFALSLVALIAIPSLTLAQKSLKPAPITNSMWVFPKGGENLSEKSTYSIQWNWPDTFSDNSKATAYLMLTNPSLGYVAKKLPRNCSIGPRACLGLLKIGISTINIPSDIIYGNGYKLQLVVDGAVISTSSEFSIKPLFNWIFPTSGAELKQGSEYTLKVSSDIDFISINWGLPGGNLSRGVCIQKICRYTVPFETQPGTYQIKLTTITDVRHRSESLSPYFSITKILPPKPKK